jgi:hypothetical protein
MTDPEIDPQPHDARCPLWCHSFDPGTGRGEIVMICTCRDQFGHQPLEPDNPEADVNLDEVDAAADRYERDLP